jgi:hypothetical protein
MQGEISVLLFVASALGLTAVFASMAKGSSATVQPLRALAHETEPQIRVETRQEGTNEDRHSRDGTAR